ncbi:AraC family transcriptional regulator [Fictibacillus nanhaiensis]|uniref:AraC family transcriptional regulator n=1 Tax=Fictibacillus nanhaiensis TaxID=742169 RepID=UPI001C94CD19|nr:helix-turn-helix domain-containing protein [Fictibacillus nanhaiensis]MBY6037520.1 AraC family transcriptional regulator [Fictibacillus nanhaiensis]
MVYEREQQKQVFRVVDYIEDHLEESLSLEKLAQISTYSPFHFQRMFKGMIGETPANYVKRLRLEKAAHLLIYDRQTSVTQIAFMCGFTSLSYFTYSFQAYFKTSPKSWREGAYLERFPREYEDSKKSKQVRKKLEDSNEQNPYTEFRWLDLDKIEIRELPRSTTVKNQRVGPYTSGVPLAWEEIYRWCESRELLEPNSTFLGVPRNNPYITPPEKSRYECHVVIREGDEVLYKDVETYSFIGGKHVVYEFEEPVDYSERSMLIECYSELYSIWLPRSGYKYLDNPVEMIQIDSKANTLSLQCNIRAISLAIEPK